MASIWIKICGITSVDDALHAARLGADAIGLNLYAPSPRHVAQETAADILAALPPTVEPVALVVNQSPEAVAERLGGLAAVRALQWHGEDPPLWPPAPYRFIPAFAVDDKSSLETVSDYLERSRAGGRLPSAILLDSRGAGLYGGTGRPAPWSLLAEFTAEVPIILAGGLTADNVAEAIRIVRPYAVDVASGVERSPGRKDADAMRRFIDQARAAAAAL